MTAVATWVGRLGRAAAPWLHRAKGPLLWAAFIAAIAVVAGAGLRLASNIRADATIDRLVAGRDVAIDKTSAPDEVVLARASYLLVRDRIDDAQTLADLAGSRLTRSHRAALFYNLANARLRLAIGAIEQNSIDTAVAQVNLAKMAYRQALRIDPAAWNAKYNLDIAMRLVRDLPMGADVEDASQSKPKELWTDLPGVPKGLP